MDHRAIAEQLEREERKIGAVPLRIGRRQLQLLRGIPASDLRVLLTEYALKLHPERASIAA